MNRKRGSKSVSFLTRGAIIAAIYVVLTYLSHLLGLSSGVIQLRLSEALCILPIFMPEAVVGVTLGCFISNTVTGALPQDILFGTLATLIGALGAYFLRRLPDKLCFIATLPTVLSNALIIPPILIFAYGATEGYWFILGTVTVGEFISATLGGAYLTVTLKKSGIFERST